MRSVKMCIKETNTQKNKLKQHLYSQIKPTKSPLKNQAADLKHQLNRIDPRFPTAPESSTKRPIVDSRYLHLVATALTTARRSNLSFIIDQSREEEDGEACSEGEQM